jgi:hypothetical protein
MEIIKKKKRYGYVVALKVVTLRERGFSQTQGCVRTWWFHSLQCTICDVYCGIYYMKIII